MFDLKKENERFKRSGTKYFPARKSIDGKKCTFALADGFPYYTTVFTVEEDSRFFVFKGGLIPYGTIYAFDTLAEATKEYEGYKALQLKERAIKELDEVGLAHLLNKEDKKGFSITVSIDESEELLVFHLKRGRNIIISAMHKLEELKVMYNALNGATSDMMKSELLMVLKKYDIEIDIENVSAYDMVDYQTVISSRIGEFAYQFGSVCAENIGKFTLQGKE